MSDETTRNIIARLHAQEEELQALRRIVAPRRAWRAARGKWHLAAFVLALLVALVPLSILAANPFTDLNPGSVHNANIDAIYNAGVTTGCVPNAEYCPNATVTREEMASFLARLGGLGTNPPAANAKTLAGYLPDALVRANGASHAPSVGLVTTNYKTLVSVDIVAPGPGYVILNGVTNLYDATNASNGAQIRLSDGTTPAPIQEVLVGTGAGYMRECSVSPTFIYQVTAGSKTFLLEGKALDAAVSANRSAITAIYVPFGPNGTPPGP